MDGVDQEQGASCIRTVQARQEKHVDPNPRTVVLGGKRKLVSTDHTPLTYANFITLPATFRPKWNELFHMARSRAEMVQKVINQTNSNFRNILQSRCANWISRAAICTVGVRVPIRSLKMFLVPQTPIACEFTVHQNPTRGLVEGIEVVSTKPMMRVHLSYLSPRRRQKLIHFKIRLFCAMQLRNHNKHLFARVWNMLFATKRVAQGYEYVSRLVRFGPNARMSKHRKRLTPWNFYGVYQQTHPNLMVLNDIQFMTQHARRDRSVNNIRVASLLDNF